MKKFLALALCLLMVIPAVFVGCAKADDAKVKFGAGVLVGAPSTTDATEDKNGSGKIDITAAAVTVDKQPIIIPQGMAGNLVINYTISSTDGSSFTETKTIVLAEIDKTNPTWEPGKKYTYYITIGTSEILIDPVIIDWAPVAIPVDVK